MTVLGQKIVVEIEEDGTRKEHPEGEVELTDKARKQGVYVIGTTGTGKTTLLKSIAYQDMMAGEGLCVVDPHGDMVDDLLECVPSFRQKDVIVFEPGDPQQFERPIGMNLLDCDRNDPRERRRITSTIIDTLYKLYFYSWGPRMEELLRNSVQTLLDPKNEDTTLLDLWLLLISPEHRLKYTTGLSDNVLKAYWKHEFSMYQGNKTSKDGRPVVSRDLLELVGSSLNKIGRFLTDPVIRNVIAQPKSAFSLRDVIEKKQILFVNLSKGDSGEDNSRLLGSVLVTQILNAAFQRRDLPFSERHPFHLIVDEYQNFATATFPTLQSEARKYGIDVIVAHQYRDQLDDLNKGSTLNVANFITMRVSGRDSYELASQFDNTPEELSWKMEALYEPASDLNGDRYAVQAKTRDGNTKYAYTPQQGRSYSDAQAERANGLSTLPDHRALCRVMEKNRPIEHTVQVFDPSKRPDLYGRAVSAMAEDIRRMSREQLGKPRHEVEEYIKSKIGDKLMSGLPVDLQPDIR